MSTSKDRADHPHLYTLQGLVDRSSKGLPFARHGAEATVVLMRAAWTHLEDKVAPLDRPALLPARQVLQLSLDADPTEICDRFLHQLQRDGMEVMDADQRDKVAGSLARAVYKLYSDYCSPALNEAIAGEVERVKYLNWVEPRHLAK